MAKGIDPDTRARLVQACKAGATALGATLDELALPPTVRLGGDPLLHVALRRATDVAAAGLLLDRGADIDARSGDGLTPLMQCAFDGRKDGILLLVARGADGAAVARADGWNALHFLMAGAETEFRVADGAWWDEVIGALLAARADPDAADHPKSRWMRKEMERLSGGDIPADEEPREPFVPRTPRLMAARLKSAVPLARLEALAPSP